MLNLRKSERNDIQNVCKRKATDNYCEKSTKIIRTLSSMAVHTLQPLGVTKIKQMMVY